MKFLALALALVGCTHAPHGTTSPNPDSPADSPTTVAPEAWGERCGNGVDDDLDGVVDEDCAGPFGGVFAPAVAADPALAAIEAASGRPLAVIQTYRSPHAGDVEMIGSDLAAIFARGQVAHLNVEPGSYTAAQYAAPTSDPLATDLAAVGSQIATSLGAHPAGRVIITFGAEMNGSWTDWGCLPAAEYIALYRAAHDAVTAALAAAHVDPRRARWAYGPNSTSSANCGSPAGYYPGHNYVDLLGLSAYRSGTQAVDAAITNPIDDLFTSLAYPDAWRTDRFVLLQTGTRALAGDDRDAWITGEWQALGADARVAGSIYFDADQYGVAAGQPGWDGLTTALAAAPPASRGLDAIFRPHFRDVPYARAEFPEIEGLADAAVTQGCATDPPTFCPDDAITAADAAALVARAVPGAEIALADPVSEIALAGALAALGLTPPPAQPIACTRARAAVLIAHAAKLVPAGL